MKKTATWKKEAPRIKKVNIIQLKMCQPCRLRKRYVGKKGHRRSKGHRVIGQLTLL